MDVGTRWRRLSLMPGYRPALISVATKGLSLLFGIGTLLSFPLTVAASAPKGFQLSSLAYGSPDGRSTQSSVSLDVVLDSTFNVLDLIEDEERKKLLASAELFLKYKRKMKEEQQKEYLKACSSQNSSDPFCHHELVTEPLEANQKFAQITNSNSPQSETGNELKLTLKSLAKLDSLQTLNVQSQAWLNNPKCLAPALYAGGGMKAEEFFPEPEAIKLATRLYERAVGCGLDSAGIQARFRLSLLSLWKGDCLGVEQLLAPLQNHPDASSLWLRAKFWRHYCALKVGRASDAARLRQEIRREYPLSFYALLLGELDPETRQEWRRREHETLVTFRSQMRPDLNLPIQAVEALLKLREKDMAIRILNPLVRESQTAELSFRMYLGALLSRLQLGLQSFGFLAKNVKEDSSLAVESVLKLFFPMWQSDAIVGQVQSIDPFLVFSLVRQESAFNPSAESSAGAMGLMQVMPATARGIQRQSLRAVRNQLRVPASNIRIGTTYLIRRLRQYDGDVELTLAAYNAGAGRVTEWLRRYPVADRLLFIDLIPFRETREYVTSILRNYFWYVLLYSEDDFRDRVAQQKRSVRIKISSLESAALKIESDTGAK